MKYTQIFIVNLFICLGLVSCLQGGFNTKELVVVSTKQLPTKNPEALESATLTIAPSPLPTLTPTLTPTPSTTPILPSPTACSMHKGRVESKQLDTTWLNAPLDYRIYLPPCYDQQPDQRYPVIYLIHGYGFNDDQWDRLGVDEVADQLISSGEVAPFIIVMPRDRSYNIQPPENLFGESISLDLIPAVDAYYRTIPSNQYRAVGGLSRGGNWAIHIGLTHWQLFNLIGAHSAPLFATDSPSLLRNWLDHIPPNSYPHFFLDIGLKDKLLQQMLNFEATLDEYNVPHEIYIFPGGHTEEYWSSHIEIYLRWYTSNW